MLAPRYQERARHLTAGFPFWDGPAPGTTITTNLGDFYDAQRRIKVTAANPTMGSWDVGSLGPYIDINGTAGDFMQADDGEWAKPANPALMGWVWPDSYPAGGMVLFSRSDDITVAGYELAVEATTGELKYAYYGTAVRGWYVDTGAPLTAGQWNHFAISPNHAAGYVRFYLNGQFQSQVSITAEAINHAASDTVAVGDQNQNDEWNGRFAGLELYDCPIKDAWVQDSYTDFYGLYRPDLSRFFNVAPAAAAGGGLSIPVAMHQYRRLRSWVA